MSNLKVEGKAADFCPKCKNRKSTTRGYDGKKDWLTEVKCEDPYDGMIKTLDADSDICCSMFEPRPDRACESEESRIEEIREGLMKITKAFTNEELIKASKRKDELIQNYREKLKKADDEINLLNSKLDKLGEYYRTDEKLIDNIQKVIFPQEEGSDYTYSYEEILNKVKELKDKYEKLDTHYQYDEAIIKDIQDVISPEDDSIWSYSEIVKEVENLKIYADENKSMYEDLEYWKERCHKAETDVTTLNSKVEVLNKRNSNQSVIIGEKGKQIEELTRRYNMIAKKLNDIHDILEEDPNDE